MGSHEDQHHLKTHSMFGAPFRTTSSPPPPSMNQQPAQRRPFLSKLPFMRPSTSSTSKEDDDDAVDTAKGARALAGALHHQKNTRRRRGSLRKVALLGRGIASDTSHQASSPLTIQTNTTSPSQHARGDPLISSTPRYDALGLSTSDVVTQTRTYSSNARLGATAPRTSSTEAREADVSAPYASTTDEDDGPHLPSKTDTAAAHLGSDAYFSGLPSAQPRRRGFQQIKSPLGYSGLTSAPLPPVQVEVDYAATEWWGWIILVVTWIVFVVGMGSCLGVWSWAWDVGKTPYAPPELEDDPTLPIVGYYPALMILTCVMAWVWVVVAWVGMKYFRHAKISGD
jgi:Phosphatidylinositol N-acetylglucosaminyltransferase subunit Y